MQMPAKFKEALDDIKNGRDINMAELLTLPSIEFQALLKTMKRYGYRRSLSALIYFKDTKKRAKTNLR